MPLTHTVRHSRLYASRPSICLRCYSSAIPPPAPPLLLKLRNDLKTAMKAKDTTRLNVLRALLADVTNASKTAKPMRTDVEMLALLRKRTASSKAAVEEFQSANRTDLVEKESAQVDILEEYAGGVQTIGEDEVKHAIQQAIEALKADGQSLNLGVVLKSLIGPGGKFEGRPVEKAEVAKLVKAYLP